MRVVLTLSCVLVAAASAAQPVPLDSLLVPHIELAPEEVSAVEAAVHQLVDADLRVHETSLQAMSCPEPGETTPLSEAEMQVFMERLRPRPELPRLGVGAHVMDALTQTHGSDTPDTAALATCFSFNPADDGAFLVLQLWAALGWNLEFSALAFEAGVLAPLAVVMLSVTAGYFAGDSDRSYLYIRPEVAYPIAFSALLYATIAAGVQAQRQSASGGTNWEMGPAVTARLVYLAAAFHPLVQLSIVYLLDTLILTPSVGVSYPLH